MNPLSGRTQLRAFGPDVANPRLLSVSPDGRVVSDTVGAFPDLAHALLAHADELVGSGPGLGWFVEVPALGELGFVVVDGFGKRRIFHRPLNAGGAVSDVSAWEVFLASRRPLAWLNPEPPADATHLLK